MRAAALKVSNMLCLLSSSYTLLQAAVEAGVAAARYLPLRYQDALKTQADLVNAPRFGSDDNYLFSSVQVNIARPVPFKEREDFRVIVKP